MFSGAGSLEGCIFQSCVGKQISSEDGEGVMRLVSDNKLKLEACSFEQNTGPLVLAAAYDNEAPSIFTDVPAQQLNIAKDTEAEILPLEDFPANLPQGGNQANLLALQQVRYAVSQHVNWQATVVTRGLVHARSPICNPGDAWKHGFCMCPVPARKLLCVGSQAPL